jgi:hypothetical protein
VNSAPALLAVPEYDYEVKEEEEWWVYARHRQAVKKHTAKHRATPPPTPTRLPPPTTLVNIYYIYINQAPTKSNISPRIGKAQ